MDETNYKQDYIVTWTDQITPNKTQEGHTKKSLKEWEGKNDLEKIKTLYAYFNEGVRLPSEKRKIIKIEKITRKTILNHE